MRWRVKNMRCEALGATRALFLIHLRQPVGRQLTGWGNIEGCRVADCLVLLPLEGARS